MCANNVVRVKLKGKRRDAAARARGVATAEAACARAITARAVSRGERRSKCNPCTSDRDYSDDEREFLMAVERYKKIAKRPWPSFTEILEVALSLGYRRVADPVPLESLPGMPAGLAV